MYSLLEGKAGSLFSGVTGKTTSYVISSSIDNLINYLKSLLSDAQEKKETVLLSVKLIVRLAILQGGLANLLLGLSLLRHPLYKDYPFDLEQEKSLLARVQTKPYLNISAMEQEKQIRTDLPIEAHHGLRQSMCSDKDYLYVYHEKKDL